MSGAFGGFYRGRKVLVTGHTGFKGSWLCLWLRHLGAEVVGFSLDVPTEPSHFSAAGLAADLADRRGDVRDYEALVACLAAEKPDLMFHLAAQSLVRPAFADPRGTFDINVMGTVNVLEAARRSGSVAAALVATSDKAYRNREADTPFGEDDRLGGHEPYSGSKACADLVVEVYQERRFQANAIPPGAMAVASARAGNVIGGGDWALDRLVPDTIRAIAAGRNVVIRHPGAVRPWQHVLDCLAGYLALMHCLAAEPESFAEAWNFGPLDADPLTVGTLVQRMLDRWPDHVTRMVVEPGPPGKEAQLLRVDSAKAMRRLGWLPCWPAATALDTTIDWYRAFGEREGHGLRATSLGQIEAYTAAAQSAGSAWAAP